MNDIKDVLEALGARPSKADDTWDLKRMKAIWFDGEGPWSDALLIAEIEEALREEGFDEFYQFEDKNPGEPPNRKVGEEFFVEATKFDGDLNGVEGTGPSKLAAWCDLFRKYKNAAS